MIQAEHGGRLPRTVDELSLLPGIGRATASSVLVFSFNLPLVFMETNIRRVYIHAFFPKAQEVKDAEILPLIDTTLDRENPREWYYALMDYGAFLRGEVKNPNLRSASYTRQAPFQGSLRQLQGRVLEVMLSLRAARVTDIEQALPETDPRVGHALAQLVAEGFLREKNGRYFFR